MSSENTTVDGTTSDTVVNQEPDAQKPQEKDKTDIAALPADIQAYIKQLRSEAANSRKLVSDKEKVDKAAEEAKLLEEKKYQELLTTRNAELEAAKAELEKTKRDSLVSSIAATAGLPKELWKKVAGSTEDDIKADVADLVKFLKPAKAPTLEAGKTGATDKGNTTTTNKPYIFEKPGEIAW